MILKPFEGWDTALRAKLKNSLTAKIFFITCLLLMLISVLTYGGISLMMPATYAADQMAALTAQSQQLAVQLEALSLETCGPLLSQFAATYDAQVILLDPSGAIALEAGNQMWQTPEAQAESASQVHWLLTAEDPADFSSDLEPSTVQTIVHSVSFSASSDVYQLMVIGSTEAVNQAMATLGRIWPWLLGAILVISVLSSTLYARLITRPIVRISSISQKMSNLDFHLRCAEDRTDEIGTLARSLNTLAGRLSATMQALQEANTSLQADIHRERELEQARLHFFSAASHELKTPITIIKGQLSGMLDGIGAYANRDKYLARSLTVLGQMEGLVQELLTLCRMEQTAAPSMTPVDLAACTQECIREYAGLFEQRKLLLHVHLTPGLWILGNPALLGKAIRNVLSNGALYSPPGATLNIATYRDDRMAIVTVENGGVHLDPEVLPHLFEAFYRADPSRSRQTGGSGLGLYLVKIILNQHGAVGDILNTAQGVCVKMQFPLETAPDLQEKTSSEHTQPH